MVSLAGMVPVWGGWVVVADYFDYRVLTATGTLDHTKSLFLSVASSQRSGARAVVNVVLVNDMLFDREPGYNTNVCVGHASIP